MNGVAIVRTLLAANGALVTAVGTAAKIKAGTIPLGTLIPSVSVGTTSGMPRNTLAQNNATRLTTERVTVTVQAKDYPTQKTLMELVRRALPQTRGSIAGVVVDSILPDQEGPDMDDQDALIYYQSRDFLVRYLAVGA